jgi:hypothetical protein
MGRGAAWLWSTSADSPNAWFASAQCGQPAGAFSGDQGFQTRSHHRSLLRDATKPSSFLQQGIVNVQRRPHMY